MINRTNQILSFIFTIIIIVFNNQSHAVAVDNNASNTIIISKSEAIYDSAILLDSHDLQIPRVDTNDAVGKNRNA